MKHFRAGAWGKQDMSPERTAEWFKWQSDDQIAVLKAHNVWYGPEHLRPEPEPEPEPAPLSDLSRPEQIIELCARWQGINTMAVRAKFRGVKAVKARQASAYLLHHHEQLTSSEIGRLLGGRDRTTAVHAVKVVTADLDAGGEKFGAIIAHVESELGLR